ncbi:MAG: hypothetical protein EOO45_00445 [Flavobacterium sp.]|nr:MAG: hypothetical protein EOO45_00445 [Flavobacterium sp.]
MQPISDDAFHTLIRVMEGFMTLSIKFKMSLKCVLKETNFRKDKRILNISQTQHVVWFLLSGLAREFREDAGSLMEKTSWFWLEEGFLWTDPGFCGQEASEKGIQVLEDSRVVLISFADWKLLRENFVEAELFTEKLRSHYARLRQHHLEDMKYLKTVQLYLNNRVLLDVLFKRVKLQLIAEYMGMAPDTLGKLRKRLSRSR